MPVSNSGLVPGQSFGSAPAHGPDNLETLDVYSNSGLCKNSTPSKPLISSLRDTDSSISTKALSPNFYPNSSTTVSAADVNESLGHQDMEIESKIDYHINFNKALGISPDLPNMREMCRNLIEKNAVSIYKVNNSVIHDDDGLGNFDKEDEELQRDDDERIDAVKYSMESESNEIVDSNPIFNSRVLRSSNGS